MTGAARAESRGEVPTMVDVVFGTSSERRNRRVFALTVAVAVVAHVALWVVATRSERSLEVWAAQVALQVHRDLVLAAPTQLEPAPERPTAPAEPEPPTPVVREPLPPPVSQSRAAAPEPRDSQDRVEPGVAGEVLAAEPDPSAPVDFTDDTFVTGHATAYAGGATASRGTSRRSSDMVGQGEPQNRAAGSLARPVRLEGNRWRCPWPPEALTEDIFEQTVLLSVRVGPNGMAETVEVLDDPGHGFGPAAIECARRTAFTPAQNRAGEPIRAASPPIRVRFRR